jgi:Ca-activated chloride channel family protein
MKKNMMKLTVFCKPFSTHPSTLQRGPRDLAQDRPALLRRACSGRTGRGKKNIYVLLIVIFFVGVHGIVEAYTLKDHLVYGKAVTAAQANEWDKADALLSDLLVDHHDDPQVLYDEAVVAYKNNDMDRAYNYFKRAAEHTTLDEARQEKACYNCANAAVGKQDLETALSWYDRTLALNPENEYAIFNRDVVRKKLEEQKQEEQKQEQEQQKDQNEQQEQEKDKQEQDQQENQQQDEQKKNGDDRQKEKNKNQQQSSENNQEQSDDSSEEQQKESDERQEQQSEPKQERGDKGGNKNQKQNSANGGSEQQERQNQEAFDDAMKDQIQKQAQEQQKKHDQSPGKQPSVQDKQEAAKKQEQAQKAAKEAAQKAGQEGADKVGQKAGAGQMAQGNAAEQTQNQGGEPDDAWLAYMLAQQDKEDKAVNKRILGAAVAHEQGSDSYEHCW